MFGHAAAPLHHPFTILLLEYVTHLHRTGRVGGTFCLEDNGRLRLFFAKRHRGDLHIHALYVQARAILEVFGDAQFHRFLALDGFVATMNQQAGGARQADKGASVDWHSQIISTIGGCRDFGFGPYNEAMSLSKLGVASFFLFACSPLFAQTATMQGLVKDQSEAAVVGAEVTITNIETGLRRSTKTNEAGLYIAPSLPLGRYTVSASLQGFAASEVPEIKLDVAQVARVDLVLKPGTVTESISVSATAALLDSETSALGQVIENKRIVELPLNGRNYLELAPE